MSDLPFWIVCLISGGIAFALVYARGFKLSAAMLVAGATGFLLSLLLLWLMPSERVEPWFDVKLAVNGSVALIFAGAGAAIGYAMRGRRE